MKSESMTVQEFLLSVLDELKSANEIHGPFASNHEAVGVIWEEFTELRDEVFGLKNSHQVTPEMVAEGRQVIAMVLKMFFCRLDGAGWSLNAGKEEANERI